MPQDEAMYAVRARWMVHTGDWITPQSWGELVYEKTPGTYWLIAFFYILFGISESTARLPAQLAGIISILLTYQISVTLLNKRLATLSAAILSISFLWLQASRLATANITFITMALLGLWCLLKAETTSKSAPLWRYTAGISFALGFLIRGQMIFVPLIALLPYLIGEHRRHRHLTSPMLYLGFVVGMLPTIAWFWLSWQRYGNIVFEQFFALAVRIAAEQRNGNSPFYYLWNTPIKAFPWPCFSILGILIVLRHHPRYRLILLGCPLIIFIAISLVSTRLPHYALMLYPFLAMLAAVALDWLGKIFEQKVKTGKLTSLPRLLSYTFGTLGSLLALAAIVVITGIVPTQNLDINLQNYALVALTLGLGWLTLPLIWIARHRWQQQYLTANYWLASWLVSVWLALAVAGSTGLLGNYNPDVKVFLQQPTVASILPNHPINFVVENTQALTTGGDKALLLLTFYTPQWGQRYHQLTEVPPGNYAWVCPEAVLDSPSRYLKLSTFRQWKLIKVTSH